MVSQVISLSRNGVSDWLIQRASAVVLAAYSILIVGFILIKSDLSYEIWSGFMNSTGMKVFSMLAIVSTCAHAWIGMWTIGSDYLREHTLGPKATALRFIFQVGSVMIIAAYLVWGINILWGNS